MKNWRLLNMSKTKNIFVMMASALSLCAIIAVTTLNSINNNGLSFNIRAEAVNCTHESVVHHERVEPGELTAGNIEYWCCCRCHKSFSDSSCTLLIENTAFEDPQTKGDGRYLAPTLASIDNANEFIRLIQLYKDQPKETPFPGEFVLSTDLDLTGKFINGDSPTEGKYSAHTLFSGAGTYAQWGAIFDGDGHTINFGGFTLAKGSYSSYAVFGSIASTGVVRNLAIKDLNIGYANNNIRGGLIAWNNYGTIENCCVKGSVLNPGAGATIGNSLFASAVQSGGTIRNCLGVDTSTTGPFNYVGVIAGNKASGGTINNCAAISTINPKISNVAGVADSSVAADDASVNAWYASLNEGQKASFPQLSENAGNIYWGTFQIGTVA